MAVSYKIAPEGLSGTAIIWGLYMLNVYKCWRCGKDVQRDVEPQVRVYCDTCKEAAEKEHQDLLQRHAYIRRQVMCDTAILKMEKAGMYMHEYYEIAKDITEEVLTQQDRYLSADEIIAAMVLKSYGVEYEVNKRIGKHVVDFYIPSMCVCLEIDGDRHEMHTIKDSRRDIDLRALLGAEWEIIRIKTNYFEKNPEELVNAIEEIYSHKKKLRKDNNGIIPEYFSRREKDLYKVMQNWQKASKN